MTEFPLAGVHLGLPLTAIPEQLKVLGVRVFQTELRNPRRLSREGVPDAADQDAFRAATLVDGWWGIAHASLLTSLGSPDPRVRNASASTLVADARLAGSLGLYGVCFHVGYAKGHETRQGAIDAVARKLAEVVAKLGPGERVMLENGCEGTELGDTLSEVAAVANAVGAPADTLGFVLDTCHLHVAGFDLAAEDAAARLADEMDAQGLVERLQALHLNDAQFPAGSRRDRHATPGDGTIGVGLRALIAHPMFRNLPAVIEVGVEDAVRGIAFLRGA